MRKVIGIGETILDIIFRNEQPSAAVPGGSVFNLPPMVTITLTRFLLPGTPDADVIFTPDTRPCNNSSTPSTWRTLTSPGL